MPKKATAKPPQLTKSERAAALQKAMAARKTRADFKARIAAGELTVADALSSDNRLHPVIGRLRVSELIRAVPGFGDARAEKLMAKIGISPTRRIRGLGPVQLSALIDALD